MRSSVHFFYSLVIFLFSFCNKSIAQFRPADEPAPKVMIADGENALEITPLHSLFNSVLIEPINRTTNKGLSTSFYLSDTSFWAFYTNSSVRLTINGNGNIVTHTPLFVNNAVEDNSSALRVNGIVKIDSAVYIPGDTNSFISINHRVKNIYEDAEDSISPYTCTPTHWADGTNLPVFRLRHPKSVSNMVNNHISAARDFMILPYEFGTAIEFNGIVECWVGEWSVHKGINYYDVEGKGNGWGGVSWVGDDIDGGGVRTTARNNLQEGGNVVYGEISVEKFGGTSNGDLRLRLPSTNNTFNFVYGPRGSENIIAKVSNQGLIIPLIPSLDSVTAPEKAQLSFDTSDNHLKIYNGTEWVNLSKNELVTGSYITSSNGLDTVYTIPHQLNSVPSYFNVLATSEHAAGINYVTADATSITIHYTTPPPSGTSNLSWNWQIKK
ncbi:hypothetical protein ACQ33O_10855 [Ferruginibacter sp. SUN002]|uniref:hypothetical protein n=1 Tax=Ferruginibacter sp. SUN002 TaxID=2937789 RepID=UPI003D360D15